MLYELSDTQVKNIQTFLQRVDLKGSEAPQLISILVSLNQPVKPEKKEKKK